MLPSTQRPVLTPGNNDKRHPAGVYDPMHGRLVYVEGDRRASWLFLNLLRALLEAYAGVRKPRVIRDIFIIHKSRVARAWLAEHGERLKPHFPPRYCPAENRIERLWLDLHANMTRNHRAPWPAALMEHVHRYLAERFHTERRLLLAA